MPTATSQPIRILIVDDHRVVREGLRMLIESEPGMRVVGDAGNRGEALALAACDLPDLVLLDLDLGCSSGMELLPELLSVSPKTRVVVLTGLRDTEMHAKAVVLGAVGLVMKEQAGDVLIRAIEKVHDNAEALKASRKS